MNMKAIDGSLEKLVRINYPADKWIDTPDVEKPEVSNDEFYLK